MKDRGAAEKSIAPFPFLGALRGDGNGVPVLFFGDHCQRISFSSKDIDIFKTTVFVLK